MKWKQRNRKRRAVHEDRYRRFDRDADARYAWDDEHFEKERRGKRRHRPAERVADA